MIKSFFAFWVDFLVGDDWTVSAAVGLALAGTFALRHWQLPAWWLIPIVVVAATAASLRRAVGVEARGAGAPARPVFGGDNRPES